MAESKRRGGFGIGEIDEGFLGGIVNDAKEMRDNLGKPQKGKEGFDIDSFLYGKKSSGKSKVRATPDEPEAPVAESEENAA